MPYDERNEPSAGVLLMYAGIVLGVVSGFVLAADIVIRTIARYTP